MRILLLLLTACGISAQGATRLLRENLEGLRNHEVIQNSGTVQVGYTPALQGTSSMRIVKGEGTDTYVLSYEHLNPPTNTVVSLATAWSYNLFQPVTLAAAPTILQFRDSSSNVLAKVTLNNDGTATVDCGGASATTSAAMSAGSPYHLWFRYTKGTGADAIASFAFSADGVRPASGNAFAQVNTGTSTGNVARVALGYLEGTSGTPEGIFDRHLVREAAIGNSP